MINLTMKTNNLNSFFEKLISTWVDHLKNIEPSTWVLTNHGPMTTHQFFSDEQREEKCNKLKDEEIALLNTDEQEMYLQTFYEEIKYYWGVSNRAYPSSISTLANQSISYLESHKLILINQLLEIDTIISMKTKLEKNRIDDEEESQVKKAPQYDDDDDDEEPWMK